MRHVFGIQAVRECIRVHQHQLQRVFIDVSSRKTSPKLEALGRFAAQYGIPISFVPRGDLDSLARGERHQGVGALAADLLVHEFDSLLLSLENTTRDDDSAPIIVALDEIEDPQNFGAIVRSAVAFGTQAILWPENHSAPLSTAMFRASAGAIEHATLCRVHHLGEALAALSKSGLLVVGLDVSGDRFLSELDLKVPLVVVMGAEGKGLRRPVKQVCHHLAKLPAYGPIESFNVSVASAITLYEITRQRTAIP